MAYSLHTGTSLLIEERRNDIMYYKLVILQDYRKWFWELRQKNDVVVIGNMAYSTKSNARRAFWTMFAGVDPTKIKEE